MPTTCFLRPLAPDRFQVHINGIVTAVLRISGPAVEIYVDRGGVELLATCADTAVGTAKRIAEGEFDDDVRFEVTRNPEPDFVDDQYRVAVYGIPSQIHLDTHHSADGYGIVQAHREAQAWQAENPGRYLMEREDEIEFGR